MEWWLSLIIFFVLLLFFIFYGFPVAFAFLIVNIISVFMLMGFDRGMYTLVHSTYDSLAKFSYTPVPLYILMGALLFHSGIIVKVLDNLSNSMRRIPGRLSIVAIGAGTLFAALSGSAVANASMLGSALVPDMQRRGYHISMIIGPILGAGSLAVIIPPSILVILMGSLGSISIGDLLIAGIIPGLMLGLMLVIYYVGLAVIKPEMAPRHEAIDISRAESIKSFLVNVLPSIVLILIVLGSIFLGFATPTESAAIGVAGSIVLMVAYKKISVGAFVKSIKETISMTGMVLLIIAMSSAFSQLLAFSGATRELVSLTLSWDVAPVMTLIIMIVIVLLLGTVIEPMSILMITIPLFMPVVSALELDPVWFGILILISLGIGNISPPFGLLLFVMKGVVPRDVPMLQIYKSVIGIIAIFLLAVVVILIFPSIVTWLPYLGRG